MNAPINALEMVPKLEVKNGIPVITLKATNRLDPEFIPSIYGPASGLLNIVCMNNPAIESPPPAKIPIVSRGILNSLIIVWEVLSVLKFIKEFQKSENETEISPANKCNPHKIGNKRTNERSMNLFLRATVIICLMFCKNRAYFLI